MRLLRRPATLLAAAAALPLVVVAVALAFRPWTPVLDMAMTELRVRDVGGPHTPLVGLPGRIGEFPDQGSHPGPWSFYLVAPFYRLAGSSAWGLELGSVAVNVAAVAGLVALGARRFGSRGALCFAALAAVAVRGYGFNVLTHPWNPYFPVLLWLLTLVAAWLVLDGDGAWAPLVVAGAVVAAQTHVPYLVSAIAIVALVLGAVGLRARTGRPGGSWRTLSAAGGVGAVMWIPPLIEQLRYRSDGNVAKLVRHFGTEQPEPAIGLGPAVRLVTQHFDLVAIGRDLLLHDDAFLRRAGSIDAGTSIVGVVVLLGWTGSVVVAWRRRHRTLLALHAVAVVGLVAGLASISRIFGKVWFYLTLWMSGTVLLVAIGLVWTGWLLLRDRPLDARAVPVLAAVAGGVATVASLVAAPGHQVPEDAVAVRELLPLVEPRLDRDLRYVVFWEEAIVPGSGGYALLDELERDGFDVGVHPTWRVPATRHRVRFPSGYDAEIHLVSGGFIDVWRSNPVYTELAVVDPRSATERERFELLHARVIERLDEIGRPDLISGVDENVFRTSLVPGLPTDIVEDLDEMLHLGDEVAVFLAPPAATS